MRGMRGVAAALGCGVAIWAAIAAIAACDGGDPEPSPATGSDAGDTTVDSAGGGGDAAPSDAAVADTGDAQGPSCDLLKPFGAPSLVGGAVNTAYEDDAIWVMPDGLAAFVSSSRFDAGSASSDLFVGVRTATADPFVTLTRLDSISSEDRDIGPVVTADGKTIYFTRGVGGSTEIYTATRSNTALPFDPAQALPPPVNAAQDRATWISPDGTVLYLVSDRATPGVSRGVYRSTRTSVGGFTDPTPVPSLDSPEDDVRVVLTADELQAFVASTRPPGGPGNVKLFHASRTTKNDGFSTPAELTELNVATSAYPTSVSADGCTLYFVAFGMDGGLGGADVFVASRPK